MFGMDLQVAYMATLHDETIQPYMIDCDWASYATLKRFRREESANYYDVMRVLVVDDSRMNRMMVVLHLKEFGIEDISQACNGLEAVHAVEARMIGEHDDKPFDIIFMDCMMPVMGGNEAITRIRGLGYAGAIVSVTGNGLPEDVSEIMSCGADRVLVKPVNEDTLRAAISGE